MSVSYLEVAKFMESCKCISEQERPLSTVTDPKTGVKMQVVQKGGKFYLRTPQRKELIGPFDSVGDLVKQVGL